MSNKEKLILSKLVKIASDQQKVLTRLAQATEHQDPVVNYLNNGLIAIVASNLGLTNVHSLISVTPGILGAGSSYVAQISGVPANKYQLFGKALTTQLDQQKPELTTNFTYTFETNQEH
jgi:hypothetical protein